MSADSPSDFDLEIAHVLFMDVVGYSKLLINEQREVLNELNQIVRGAQQFRNAEAAGKLIRLPTGDGMALAFFTTRTSRRDAHWKSAKRYRIIRTSGFAWEFIAARSTKSGMLMTP